MGEAGIRELRDHLSRYLERVRRGEELIVTDRGKPIARVLPVDGPRAYDELVAAGVIEQSDASQRRRPTKRIVADGTVSDLVDDQRR